MKAVDDVTVTQADLLRDLASRLHRAATPAMGFDQGDTDLLYAVANRLVAETRPTPGSTGLVEYIGHPELGTADPDFATEARTAPAQGVVAMRYDFDGYGWRYIDNGSGSDWMTRHPDAEPLFAATISQGRDAPDARGSTGLVEAAQKATCAALGYKDWGDATDYRTTGEQDRQRDQVFDAILAALREATQ